MGTQELVAMALKLDPAERRLAAYRAGKVQGIPAEKILGE